MTLPHSLDAERAILGGIVVRNSALDTVIDTLPAEAFFRDAHKRIFAAMLRLHGKGVAIDLVTLKDALQQSGELDAVGGVATLAALPDGVPVGINVAAYVTIVKRTATASSS